MVEAGIVKFSGDQPFRFTSNRLSPVYVNMREAVGLRGCRRVLVDALLDMVSSAGATDCLAGGETAGIPYAAILADRVGCDFAYVRKKTKEFGTKQKIEGAPIDGQCVILVEDLTTDGGSKIDFINSIREAGGIIDHILTPFWYGFEAQTRDNLAGLGVDLHYLCSWADVRDIWAESMPASSIAQLDGFLKDPDHYYD